MELGFSGEGFGNSLFVLWIIASFVYTVVYWGARSRGIEVTSGRFQFKVLSTIIVIFFVIPFLFCDLDILWKIIGIVTAAAVGFINYISVDRTQKYLRDRFNKDLKTPL